MNEQQAGTGTPTYRFDKQDIAERELDPLLKAAFDKARELGINFIFVAETAQGQEADGSEFTILHTVQCAENEKEHICQKLKALMAMHSCDSPQEFIMGAIPYVMMDASMSVKGGNSHSEAGTEL